MIVHVEELGDLVDANPGLLHLPIKSEWRGYRFIPILSLKQMRSRQEHDMQVAMLFDETISDEPSISSEDLAGKMRGPGGSPRVMFIRPRTKKALREAVRTSAESVFLEETSVFGNEFEGWLSDAPQKDYSVVGPDPQRQRSWFGTIRWSEKKGWTVD